jgi:hypothetical protein
MSHLLFQVLLRCFLEPSHACFLTSNACGESDCLLDSRRNRVAGTSKSELSVNASAGPLATLDDAYQGEAGSIDVRSKRKANTLSFNGQG